jgi:hypothetical protein
MKVLTSGAYVMALFLKFWVPNYYRLRQISSNDVISGLQVTFKQKERERRKEERRE